MSIFTVFCVLISLIIISSCSVQTVPSGAVIKENCVPQWECTDWSECSDNNVQSRICKDKMNCGITINKPLETQSCILTESQIKKKSININYDDLFRYNEQHIGKTVYYRGQVNQVGDGFMRVSVTSGNYDFWEDVVFVHYKGNERFLEGDIIDFWGKIKGLYTYTAVLGNEVTIPEINALFVNLVKKVGDKSDTTNANSKLTLAPSEVIKQNTEHGITLIIHSVNAVKKGQDWGKITDLEFTIKNNGESTIYTPTLLFYLFTPDYSYVNGIEQKAQVRDMVELDSYLQPKDILTKDIAVNAAYNGDMSKPIALRITLANGAYSPESIVSVEFNIEFK
ncbi:hypothetical protein HYX07_01560 [Candidatus Woesearchaeota archaeon]|nr:hypothetical protein [Candidatus Woesearchaeota archaeon]